MGRIFTVIIYNNLQYTMHIHTLLRTHPRPQQLSFRSFCHRSALPIVVELGSKTVFCVCKHICETTFSSLEHVK
jgi:hypothetical protein